MEHKRPNHNCESSSSFFIQEAFVKAANLVRFLWSSVEQGSSGSSFLLDSSCIRLDIEELAVSKGEMRDVIKVDKFPEGVLPAIFNPLYYVHIGPHVQNVVLGLVGWVVGRI
ncbi:hypothetical protein HAX54_035953 [Datura stramonium]|uniref:Uncharacterized protein n=1 Tax=Datura stramonium TaxID=4076 RepID=A0ABS8SGN9_DATST|nr:hypothetical protein [Datura stramonium]